ncbi:hypothetical protein RRG08_034378 [Elysia crispata]|uniref:Uncharacterized protein n=1 Tax=Elysia crispata TaxID=231223 RepID=A0AAE1CWE8_9GAST|nr:hypothetical protein RRG08_034378 [Elysia crispata]
MVLQWASDSDVLELSSPSRLPLRKAKWLSKPDSMVRRLYYMSVTSLPTQRAKHTSQTSTRPWYPAKLGWKLRRALSTFCHDQVPT